MPSESGRCGWCCVSANLQTDSLSRRRIKHLLRRLANHLHNQQAISLWIEELETG